MASSSNAPSVTLNELFRTLGVGFSSNESDLRRAFHRKQRIHHPDKGGNEELSKKINQAYRILSDKNLRAQYDFAENDDDNLDEYADLNDEEPIYLTSALRKSESLKVKIEKWKEEFENTTFNNNFSESMFTLLNDILTKASPRLKEDDLEKYYCSLCDKSCTNMETHFEKVLSSYENVIFGQCLEKFDYKQDSIFKFLYDTLGKDAYECEIFEFSKTPLEEYWSHEKKQRLLEMTGLKQKSWLSRLLSPNEKEKDNLKDKPWVDLAFDELNKNNLDDAILCLKALSTIEKKEEGVLNHWGTMGFKMHEKDPLRAHVCFLSGCYDLREIAVKFIAMGNHDAAISYLLHVSDLEKIRYIGKQLLDKKDEVNAFRYLAAVAQSLEEIIGNDEYVVGNLIEIVKVICGNDKDEDLTKMYQKIMWTFPETFNRPIAIPIHDYFINRAKALPNVANGKFLLAAAHFSNSTGVSPEFVQSFSGRVIENELKATLYPNLITLGPILSFVNTHSVSALENYLETKESFTQLGDEVGSCLYLMRGTVNKIQGNWQEALEDFVTSFEMSPIAMKTRADVLASIFQCMNFHENILLEILYNVEKLRDQFKKRHDIDVTQFPFLLTKTSPSKICKLPNIFVPTSNLKTVKKNELGIQARLKDPLEAALYYYDLSDGVEGVESVLGVYLMSASKFLEAISGAENPAAIFAYKNAISEMCLSIYAISLKYTNPFICTHVSRMIMSMLISSNQFLAQSVELNRLLGKNESIYKKALLIFKKNKVKQEQDVMSVMDLELIKVTLKGYLQFGVVNPVVTFKMVSALDLIYMEHFGTQFLESFWNEKIASNEFSSKLPFHLFAYHRFDGVWHNWFKGVDFQGSKTVAMDALLENKGWNSNQVVYLMNYPLIRRDRYGWLDSSEYSLCFHAPEAEIFSSVEGFEINTETGDIKFTFSKGKGRPNLFTLGDVREIFERRIFGGFFTLDEPDCEMPSHPFYHGRYGPVKDLRGTNFLYTAAWVDMLLKQFTLGVEINSLYPFEVREAHENLLKRLPEHLKEMLKPLAERRDRSTFYETTHRFWVDFSVEEIEMRTQVNGDVIKEQFGKMPVHIRKRLMKRNENGELVDDLENDSDETVEADFAKVFTKNYSEIGKYFPELLRLKELMKLTTINMLLIGIYSRTKKQIADINTSTEFEANVEKSVRQFLSQFSTYPQSTWDNVNTEMDRILASNGYGRYQVSSSELTRVENEIRKQLNQIDSKMVENVGSQLEKAYHVPRSEMDRYLPAVLRRESSPIVTVINLCIKHERSHIVAPLERLCRTILELGIQPDKDVEESEENETDEESLWYPAAFLSKKIEKNASVTHHIKTHGGVRMAIKGINQVPGQLLATRGAFDVSSRQIANSSAVKACGSNAPPNRNGFGSTPPSDDGNGGNNWGNGPKKFPPSSKSEGNNRSEVTVVKDQGVKYSVRKTDEGNINNNANKSAKAEAMKTLSVALNNKKGFAIPPGNTIVKGTTTGVRLDSQAKAKEGYVNLALQQNGPRKKGQSTNYAQAYGPKKYFENPQNAYNALKLSLETGKLVKIEETD